MEESKASEAVETAVVAPAAPKVETAVVKEAPARKRPGRDIGEGPYFTRAEDGTLVQTDKP